jgi:hypothetical protein
MEPRAFRQRPVRFNLSCRCSASARQGLGKFQHFAPVLFAAHVPR